MSKIIIIAALYLLGCAVDILRLTGDQNFKTEMLKILNETPLPEAIVVLMITIAVIIRGLIWPISIIDIPKSLMKSR